MKNDYLSISIAELQEQEEIKLMNEMETLNSTGGPSNFSIQKILGYSKALKVNRSRNLGLIELLSN